MIPIILDCNATCHKAKHTLGELTNETMKVGVIFGFFMQIFRMAKEHDTNQFIFTWDSKKSHRTKLFPAYKERRRSKGDKPCQHDIVGPCPECKEEDEYTYAQFDMLCDEILPAIGFKNNFKVDGFEGDDLIASVIDSNPDSDFYIASGDEDMYQCLCPGVTILKSNGKMTEKKFMKEYGIDPYMWVEVKALAGCKSDEVPGIKGIGEATAIKYLRGELTPHLKGYKSIVSAEGKAIRKRNIPLVKLPFEGCPQLIYTPDTKLSLDAFMDMCVKYNFQYFLKKDTLAQWKSRLQLR